MNRPPSHYLLLHAFSARTSFFPVSQFPRVWVEKMLMVSINYYCTYVNIIYTYYVDVACVYYVYKYKNHFMK